MSLQYYDSDNEALIPIAGNVNPSDVIELKATKADKTQISNPNLLDNPWFTVNQRNFVDTSLYTYTVDRWKTRNTTLVSYSNGIISITSNRSDGATWFGQNLELVIARRLIGKTVTASILTGSGTLESWTFVVPAEGTNLDTTHKTVDGVECYFRWEWSNSCLYFYIWLARSAYQKTLTLNAVKLELGSVSTLAMDTAPNYALELLKCQRYFLRVPNTGLEYPSIGNGSAFSTTEVEILIPTPIEMRTLPSVYSSGYFFIRGGGIATGATIGNVHQYGVHGLTLVVTGTNLINNYCYELVVSNDTAAYINFSADL